MNWDAALFLSVVILIGYFPYKYIIRIYPNGLNAINPPTAYLLSMWFFGLSAWLFIKTPGVVIDISLWVLLLFFATLGVWLFTHRIVRIIGTRPQNYITSHPKSFVVRFERDLVY